MRLGRPVPPIVLTTDERDTLERWTRRPTTAQALALRARLVLRCAAGETATAVARDLHVTKQTVGKWRGRFVARRLRAPIGRSARRASLKRSHGRIAESSQVVDALIASDLRHSSSVTPSERSTS
jgi:hypothetical protein